MIVVWSGVSFQLFFAVRVDAGGSLRSTFHNETEYARCSVESPPRAPWPCHAHGPRRAGLSRRRCEQ